MFTEMYEYLAEYGVAWLMAAMVFIFMITMIISQVFLLYMALMVNRMLFFMLLGSYVLVVYLFWAYVM